MPFPKNYFSSVKKILTRLHRVFVHVYIHHFDKLVGLGAVSRLMEFLSMHFKSKRFVVDKQYCCNLTFAIIVSSRTSA